VRWVRAVIRAFEQAFRRALASRRAAVAPRAVKPFAPRRTGAARRLSAASCLAGVKQPGQLEILRPVQLLLRPSCFPFFHAREGSHAGGAPRFGKRLARALRGGSRTTRRRVQRHASQAGAEALVREDVSV
jgi:hypothetical protein